MSPLVKRLSTVLIVIGVLAVALFFAGLKPEMGGPPPVRRDLHGPETAFGGVPLAEEELPFLQYSVVSLPDAAPSPAAFDTRPAENAAAPPPESPAGPDAATMASLDRAFAVNEPIILADGREIPSTAPLGIARIGGTPMPVYYSSLKFYRPAPDGALDPLADPSRIHGREIREIPLVRGQAPSAPVRARAVEELRGKGYVPALLLPHGERVIPTGELNVIPRPEVAERDFLEALRRLGLSVTRRATESDPWWLLKTTSRLPEDVLKAANAVASAVPCMFAEPNWIREVRKRSVPTDPYYPKQWHLSNTGQTGGTSGADIKAEGAWDITTGNDQVIIAIFDDGFDMAHTDGPGSAGYVSSRDFVRNTSTPTPADADPEDPDNHGTSVWGLISAVHSNNKGVAGVAPGVKFMLLRTPMELDERGTADAIRWAADKGAHIMSNSWGYSHPGSVVTTALSYARTSGRGGKGTLVFFASGNENADIGVTSDLSNNVNVLAIGATTHQDKRTTYSNYGARLFAVAPAGYGENVGLVSPDRTGAAGYTSSSYCVNTGEQFDGTSGACPIAAGIAGLVFSVNPNFTATQVETILRETADKVQTSTAAYNSAGRSAKYGFGRLNAAAAVERARIAGGVPGGQTGERVKLFAEDFEALADGARSVGGKWSLVATGASGSIFQVATVSGNKYLKAAALQGVAQWKTAPINIAGHSDVTIKVRFAEIGTLEIDDVIEGWYQIDGHAPIRWFMQADDVGSTYIERTAAGLSGSSMLVWVTVANGASEEWRLDGIEVSGVTGGAAPPPPPPSGGGVLFKEDFESLADGAKSSSGRWSLVATGASGSIFQVATVSGNKYLKAAALQGVARWKTAAINIAGQNSVTISAKFAEIGTLEADDVIEGWYQVDGKTPVRWFVQNDDAGSAFVSKSVSGISGSTLLVWVTFANGASEEWRLDEIVVASSSAAPTPAPSPAPAPTTGSSLFREDFESLADGATGVSGKWTLTPTGATGSIVQVNTVSGNKYLKVANVQGVAQWKTAPIALSGYRDIAIRLKFAEIGTLEADDVIEGWYQIDGRTPVKWFSQNDDAGSAFLEKSVAGLSGASLTVWVTFANGASEEWRIDDIEVTGTPIVTGYATTRRRATPVTVVAENFENLARGVTGQPGSWITEVADAGALRVATARTRRFLAGTSLAGGGAWRTAPANIEGLRNVSLRMKVSEIGRMERDDVIRALFRIDGGDPILWFEHVGQIPDGARGMVKTLSGLSGRQIEVIVAFRNNAASEAWRIDNFTITGDRP